MTVIWSGITEEGAVVPVQVEESGKVVAQGYPGEKGDKGDKGDPGEEGAQGPPGEYSKGDDVELNDAYFSGAVGIGTSDPDAPLHIASNLTSCVLRMEDAGTDIPFYLQTLGNDFRVVVAGGERVRVRPNGYVGVNTNDPQSVLDVNGDLILKSRNKKWMIVEQSGLAHLVEQSVFLSLNPPPADADADSDSFVEPVETVYPNLRDIPGELSLVEQALSEVFEKLRMSPPVGWPVWDGQSEVTSDNDNA